MKTKIPLKIKGLMKEYNLKNKKVLDIGCGYGEALKNFGKYSVGIELDKKRANIAKKTGKKILKINIEEKDINEKFDAVWISHVLEHTTSPLLILNKINKLLDNKKGLIFVTVPLISSSIFNLFYYKFKNIKGWNANMHSYAFCDKSLEFLLKNSGFKILKKGYFISENKVINLILSPIISRILAQKTFIAIKDESMPKPRISPPKRYKKIIRHETDYIREDNNY